MIEIVAVIDSTHTLEVLALVRIIPYAVGAYIAYQKGYKHLALGAGSAGALVLANYLFNMDIDVRNVLFNIVAWLLMVHALRLIDNNRKES